MSTENTLAELTSQLTIVDENQEEWLDITQLMQQTTQKEMLVGEMIKPPSFSLFDAITAIEMMDPRLDSGMNHIVEGQAAFDMDRELTLNEVLWIANRMFSLEMTWHNSAALLQTLYTCNYFTADRKQPQTTLLRDRVLYPMLIAMGACCRRVWNEYCRENLYPDEDVHLGSVTSAQFLDQRHSLTDAYDLLSSATDYLTQNSREETAGQMLLGQLEIRKSWLTVLVRLSVENLQDDPSSLGKGVKELHRLQQLYKTYMDRYGTELEGPGTKVEGVFDQHCMRNYPMLAPVRPRDPMPLAEAYRAMDLLLSDMAVIEALADIQSIDTLLFFFQRFGQRQPEPLPFARSLVLSVLNSKGEILTDCARRAIGELCSDSIWQLPLDDGDSQRLFVFLQDAGRLLVDWFRAQCQNPSRQRRIALKYLVAWDAIQCEAEQLDMLVYIQLNEPKEEEECGNPAFNPFWLSSWCYHMKLLLAGMGLLGGIRLQVYGSYEFPAVFCYLTQIYEAHQAHLTRLLNAPPLRKDFHPSAESKRRLERWLALACSQKDIATGLWLSSHALERLQLFKPPWALRKTPLALQVCQEQEQQERQKSRFELRFRALSRLGSPSPLTFEAWSQTQAQLDTHPLADLLVHAGKLLGGVRNNLPVSQESRWVEETIGALRYVAVANGVGLAKLRSLQRQPQLRAVLEKTGAQTLAYRQHILANSLKKKSRKKKKTSQIDKEAREWQEEIDRLTLAATFSCSDQHPGWPLLAFSI